MKKKIKIRIYLLLFFIFLITLNFFPCNIFADNNSGIDSPTFEYKEDDPLEASVVKKDWKQNEEIKSRDDISKFIFEKLDLLFNIFLGFCIFLSISLFIIAFMRLQSASTNSGKRAEVSKGIIYLAIGTGLIGGFGFLFPLIFNLLR